MHPRIPALLVVAVVCLGACDVGPQPARADETDRVARVVADAISYPRQDSAAGFARAANDTTAAKDGRLTVIEVDELHADDLQDPLARLVFRIHLVGSQAGFNTVPAVTTCYTVEFSRYGVIGDPDRTRCPVRASAASVAPAPLQPDVPVGADAVVRRELRRADEGPQAAELQAAIVGGLSALVDPSSALPPQVQVEVAGDDIGVAASGHGRCLLGRRVGGHVEVWHPPSITVQPGELSCSPDTALAGLAQHAPH